MGVTKDLHLTHVGVVQYNKLGVGYITNLFYRVPLFKKEGLLWKDTKIDIGIQNSLSPATWSLRFFANIEPLSILRFDLCGGSLFFYDLLLYK